MSDWELLKDWVDRRSDAAFGELVRRYVNLVYGSALRQTAHPEMARDISQAVFLLLARKARRLRPPVILSGWLFRTTRHVAARAIRSERRRTRYESEAFRMQTLSSSDHPPRWGDLRPVLDAALTALPAADRNVIIVRFLEEQPFRAVGERFGISEDGAKKRVERAIEKLRRVLRKRGFEITATALGVMLGEIPAEAAPSGMADAIANSVSASFATHPGAAPRRAWEDSGPLRRLLPVGIAVFIGAFVLWRFLPKAPVHEGGSSLLPQAVAALVPPSSSISANSFPKPGKSIIFLAVQAAEDHRPLQASVFVSADQRVSEKYANERLATGADGLVEIPVNGAAIYSVSAWVSAPGRVPMLLEWRDHKFVEPALHYTLRLRRGRTLTGIVQDENGVSVAGARISFDEPGLNIGERENISYHYSSTSVLTDTKGQFRSDQLPVSLDAHRMSYSVEHPGYIRATVPLELAQTLETNHVVILKKGLNVRGRVLDEFGNPVSGAAIKEIDDFTQRGRKADTDSDGNFEIGPFTPGGLNLVASASGFKESRLRTEVGGSETNLIIRLAAVSDPSRSSRKEGKTVRMIGTVFDAITGEPVSSFRVRMAVDYFMGDMIVGDGHDGKFDWPVFFADNQKYALKVAAEGYTPVSTENRKVETGTSRYEIKLQPSSEISGQVITDSGEPAFNAFVGLNGINQGWLVRKGIADSSNNAPSTRTDSHGRFSFKPIEGARSVLVVSDLGCSQVTVSRLSKPIVLRPWGSIRGKVLMNGRPMAGQEILIGIPDRLQNDEEPGVSSEETAATSSDGSFSFPKLPAGPLILSRMSMDKGGRMAINDFKRVVIPAGSSTEVTFDIVGRTLVGKLALSRPLAGHDWRDDLQMMDEENSTPPRSNASPRSSEWHRQEKERQLYWMSHHRYSLPVNSDGTFRLEGVAPGDYLLKLGVSEPPDPLKRDYENMSRKALGSLTVPVHINAGASDEPQDLGEIVIPLDHN